MSFTKKQYQDLLIELKQHQEKVMKGAIKESIETCVNGGVRGIKKTLDDYIIEDTKWKVDAQPSLDNMKNVTGIWKFVVALAFGVGAIAGSIVAIKKLIGQ